ncbi:LysR family transcriptional regulator [Bordetella sp. BOR01]|uniref:LysR family transcriptional regulator n=1 Tax=Bordetella sp. BOR01 TaxID=2854779 RepID=UPI001C458FFD|nr:LysR family transcriptional regulator [Bordetella sp. BOR01]MBV7483338.1 LysR family transcriptional regulator [Bordetella sp. BOR01]
MQKMFNAQRLQYFLQVTVSGSLRGAAETLDVDPSSISRAIAQLERETGLRLLERKGRGVVPSEAGNMLARYARRQLEILEDFHNDLRQSRDATRGHIGVGLGEGMLHIFFHPIITDYMRDHPHITLDLAVASVDQNVSNIVEDKVDIAMLYHGFNDVRLRHHFSMSCSPIQVIVRKSHPLAEIDRPLRLKDLSPYKGAALHENFGLRQYVRAAEISEQVQLKHVLTTSSFRALWQFAQADLGYTLCPTSFAAWFNMPDLVALPLSNPIFNQGGITIVTRAGRHISAAATSLLKYLATRVPHLSMHSQAVPGARQS